ncbi:acyltransferase family protein [Actinophytocola oryzae]|uniref:Peptidoglycan/LPS O-acetylase OafA/YrhL n=1 Tax=Actinophytocola oryzae TaxID=502181 RepID=A0A4R7V2I7_9PSEU|nr:acyltransferase [Actinophytocola oryzae]TDV43568.1 peptidoglycan/LPS O-acetylase OafA/YrhL [Actinophytocola oryzae]
MAHDTMPARVRVVARPRLEVLDGLRFVAAIVVVGYHYTTLDRVWQRPAAQVFPDQTFAYGWLGVYLFFLISGFVICMSSWGRGVGAFLASRVVRLYPAYWLSVVVVAAVAAVWPWRPQHAGLGATLVNLTMFQDAFGVSPVAEVYWTLWAELRFYLLFSLVVWWGLTYRQVVGFCVAWLAAVAVAKVVVPDGVGVVHTVLMTDYAPLFVGGVGCYLMYRFRPTLVTWGIIGASFVLSVPTTRFRAGQEAYPGQVVPTWPAVVLTAVCFALVAAVALGWLAWLRGRWLVVLGSVTYPLYLLHLDLGAPVLFRWQGRVPPAVLVCVVAAVMIGLAWLAHRFVERPVARWWRGRRERGPVVG